MEIYIYIYIYIYGNERQEKRKKIKGQQRTKRNDAVTIMKRMREITEKVETMRGKI